MNGTNQKGIYTLEVYRKYVPRPMTTNRAATGQLLQGAMSLTAWI